jgi:hypothetical protein
MLLSYVGSELNDLFNLGFILVQAFHQCEVKGVWFNLNLRDFVG